MLALSTTKYQISRFPGRGAMSRRLALERRFAASSWVCDGAEKGGDSRGRSSGCLSVNHDISLFLFLNLFLLLVQGHTSGVHRKKEVSQRWLGMGHYVFLSLFLLITIFFFFSFRIWEAWISIYSICLDDALHLFFPAPRGRREPSFCLFIGLGDIHRHWGTSPPKRVF